MNVGIWEKDGAFLFQGNPDRGVFIPDPELYLEFIPIPDFSQYSVTQFRALYAVDDSDVKGLVPADGAEISISSIQDTLIQTQAAQDDLDKKIKEVEQYKDEALAEMQARIRKLQDELYAKKESMLQSFFWRKREIWI